MPRIVETIVTTIDAGGTAHIAPLGLIADGDGWVHGAVQAVAHARQPACSAVRRRQPYRRRARVRRLSHRPARLAAGAGGESRGLAAGVCDLALGATRHRTSPRTRCARAFHCVVDHVGQHRPWEGFSRAQAAVLECAVLVSRLEHAAAGEGGSRAEISRDRDLQDRGAARAGSLGLADGACRCVAWRARKVKAPVATCL